MKGVGGRYTVRELGTELLEGGDFSFGLVANATSASDFSMQEVVFC